MIHRDLEKAASFPTPSVALQVSALQASAPIVLALAECDEELRAEAIELFKQLASGELDEEQRFATVALLAEILFPNADSTGAPGLDLVEAETISASNDPEVNDVLARMDKEEAFFADRLRELMAAKGLTQAELAAKVGIGQPAVSMMLNRVCRPQRKTVLRFAEALGVSPEELWPQPNCTANEPARSIRVSKSIIDFPVWVIVNLESHATDGFPHSILMEKGGPLTPIPKTLGVYTTPDLARQMHQGFPFGEVEVNQETLYEILKINRQQFEQVSIDLGTRATRNPPFRVEELIAAFEPGLQN